MHSNTAGSAVRERVKGGRSGGEGRSDSLWESFSLLHHVFQELKSGHQAWSHLAGPGN